MMYVGCHVCTTRMRGCRMYVECVVPHSFHVVPVDHHSVLDRVVDSQYVAFGDCLMADQRIVRGRCLHSSVPGTPHDGGKLNNAAGIWWLLLLLLLLVDAV